MNMFYISGEVYPENKTMFLLWCFLHGNKKSINNGIWGNAYK